MLEAGFFLLVLAVLAYGVLRRPGLVLAYILLFQGLNNLVFDLVDLSALRYGTTLVAFPALLMIHYPGRSLGRFSSTVFRSGMLQGYLLLTFWIVIYAVFLYTLEPGGAYGLSFLASFLFPGFALFAIAAAMIYAPEVYRDLCWGVLLFSVLTFVAIVGFNVETSQAFYADRTAAGAATGMSVITQGRMAGLLALLAVLLVVRLPARWKVVPAGGFVLSLYWLFLAGSRGPALALAVTVFLYALLSERRLAPVLYPALLVAGIGIVVLQFGLGDAPLATRTLTAVADPDYLVSTQRYERWVLFLGLLPEHFLFGLGPGGWGHLVWDSPGSYPHNIVIEFVLEYGVVGALALAMIVVAGARTSWNVLRDRRFGVYHHALVLGWVYYLLNTMVSGGIIHGNQPFFALTGLLVGLGVISRVDWEPEDRRSAPAPAAAAP